MLKPLNVKRQGKDDECTRGGAKVSSIAEKAINEKAAWLGWRGEKIKGLLKNFFEKDYNELNWKRSFHSWSV